VASAAGKNLVPCILELGGKSPVIVDKEADIYNAASRIAMGRFFLYLDLPMQDKPVLQLIMCLFTKTFELPFYKRFKPKLMNFIPKMPKNHPIMLA
jgi:hypothetical protein